MKNPATWAYILKNFPNAVIDFKYSHGDTLFYTDKVAADELNESKLYCCFPVAAEKDGFKIVIDFYYNMEVNII